MKRYLAILAVLTVAVMTSGCCSTFYHPRYPVLERPDRPKLINVPGTEMTKMSAEAQKDVTTNFNSLIDYARKLEVAIDTYNLYATEQNKVLNTISKDK